MTWRLETTSLSAVARGSVIQAERPFGNRVEHLLTALALADRAVPQKQENGRKDHELRIHGGRAEGPHPLPDAGDEQNRGQDEGPSGTNHDGSILPFPARAVSQGRPAPPIESKQDAGPR